MEAFRKTILHRLWAGRIFVVLILALTIVRRFTNYESLLPENILAFSIGLAISAEIVGIFTWSKYTQALRDEEKLKELYIFETDERNVMIRVKTGGTAINMIMGALVCAALIAGIFNETVFFTLVATLFFIALVKGILKVYYNRKL
jgi:hypothetical protein